MKRNIVIIIGLGLLYLLGQAPPVAQAGGVSVVAVDATSAEAQAAGLQTCRVYVVLENQSYNLGSVYDSNISTDDPEGFYQHDLGEDLAPDPGVCPLPGYELVCSDSFVTIGTDSKAGNTTMLDPDFSSDLFNPPEPQGLCVGGWFNSDPDNAQGLPDENMQVLMAQFTVRQGFAASGSFNVCILNAPGLCPVPVSFECPQSTCASDDDCDDAIACTVDACTASGCVYTPDHSACDDGNACTNDACSKSGCTNAPNSDSCEDGDACTAGDACAGGACIGGPPPTCAQGVPLQCGQDCNNNQVVDSCDIESGTSQDRNADGIPDECACPADLTGNGVVSAGDLALLLGAWGPNPGHPADLNDSGAVSAADLALLLGAWGPCD